jgi:hypothetical protein
MKTIEANATVASNGQLIVQVPPEITPGEYHVVLVIEEKPVKSEQKRPPLDFPVDSVGPWPADLTLRREEMYDDEEF